MRLRRIVSGGQTGVDRGALDAAAELGLERGGWCPKGRRAEDGRVPEAYPLVEAASADYAVRTELNVLDAEATLILCRGRPTGGTALTVTLARRHRRPYRVVDLDAVPFAEAAARIHAWVEAEGLEVLNVAGPRESGAPGIAEAARALLVAALDRRA